MVEHVSMPLAKQLAKSPMSLANTPMTGEKRSHLRSDWITDPCLEENYSLAARAYKAMKALAIERSVGLIQFSVIHHDRALFNALVAEIAGSLSRVIIFGETPTLNTLPIKSERDREAPLLFRYGLLPGLATEVGSTTEVESTIYNDILPLHHPYQFTGLLGTSTARGRVSQALRPPYLNMFDRSTLTGKGPAFRRLLTALDELFTTAVAVDGVYYLRQVAKFNVLREIMLSWWVDETRWALVPKSGELLQSEQSLNRQPSTRQPSTRQPSTRQPSTGEPSPGESSMSRLRMPRLLEYAHTQAAKFVFALWQPRYAHDFVYKAMLHMAIDQDNSDAVLLLVSDVTATLRRTQSVLGCLVARRAVKSIERLASHGKLMVDRQSAEDLRALLTLLEEYKGPIQEEAPTDPLEDLRRRLVTLRQ
ncbi:hypothetical protein GNI_038490 [Gregarina niphandrodes]|uniref:Uncharacterized protein n=1 Tax=Gregarina niphandrodes TaxID=110365 RepID=A0A023BAJ2_GRENI|nr:hypothetical protein GNI_038490 [Gregarina niphandrodes]EZG78290.1 hypothetical protein GNI_038490 [Gregarina niphandrodes]|eukprot:XP_011129359.1 hypothetical protein GNI_038490 [Gregarina niphandrodes]